MKRFLLLTAFLFSGTLSVVAQDDGGRDDGFHVGGTASPDGTLVVQTYLPENERMHNTGGRDGAGLCVFTSINHAGRWQNEKELNDFQQKMKKEPGGGYPQKVDAMMKKYAPGVSYIQYEGNDSKVIDLALKTGRMPCVTYDGHDPHYGGGISHMVNIVAANDQWACVMDNNFPSDKELVWMSKKAFMQRFGGDGGWAVVLLKPGAPPEPWN